MSDSKVVLITGSSSGVGRATAHLFASKGFKVAIHGSTSLEKVNKVVDECNKLSPNNDGLMIKGFVADFRNPDNAETLVEQTIQHFKRLDTIVCCAGYVTSMSLDSPDWFEKFQLIKSIHVDSHVRLLIAASPHLLKSNDASVIVIKSNTESPCKGYMGYFLVYAALGGFVKSLASELAPNVRVSSISLGAIDTPAIAASGLTTDDFVDLTVLKRCGKVEEVAKNIWHLSQEATYVTGIDMVVDGGGSLLSTF